MSQELLLGHEELAKKAMINKFTYALLKLYMRYYVHIKYRLFEIRSLFNFCLKALNYDAAFLISIHERNEISFKVSNQFN